LGFRSPDALIGLAMLSLGGLCRRSPDELEPPTDTSVEHKTPG
jgi:hypothetical protein